MEVSIRLANKGDLGDIVKLNDQIQLQHTRQYPDNFKYPLDSVKVSRYFESLIDSEENVVIVATDNQSVIGYLYYEKRLHSGNIFTQGKSRFFIHHVLVDQGCRRLGTATSLFKWVEGAAREEGMSEIALDTMMLNHVAQLFFKQCGYNMSQIRFTKSLK